MRETYKTCALAVLFVVILVLLLHIILRERTSGAALPSVKTLTPLYPYTRRSTIRHADFEPVTLQQTTNPDFNFELLGEMIKEKVNMYDTQMMSIIRNYVIEQPTSQQYRLENAELFDYSGGQSAAIDNILRFKESGFYVECCNTDGEKDSISLFFERVRKWNGLVITSDPEKFTALTQKNRKAMIMNSCLSPDQYPVQKIVPSGYSKDTQNEIHCFPLYTIMASLQRTTIDMFALDVGGDQELFIIKSVPFHKLDIHTITVRFKGEIRHYKSEVQLYLEDHGYDTVLKLVKEDDDSVHHLILKKRPPAITQRLLRSVLLLALIGVSCSILYLYVSTCYQRRQTAYNSF